MELEDPLKREDELRTLFRSVEAPAPSADFAERMRAVTREPLPAGRRALRSPLASMSDGPP